MATLNQEKLAAQSEGHAVKTMAGKRMNRQFRTESTQHRENTGVKLKLGAQQFREQRPGSRTYGITGGVRAPV